MLGERVAPEHGEGAGLIPILISIKRRQMSEDFSTLRRAGRVVHGVRLGPAKAFPAQATEYSVTADLAEGTMPAERSKSRPCCPTRFRDPAAMRNGQLSALGQDVLELVDALGFAALSRGRRDWGRSRRPYCTSAPVG